tara:strand:- start:5096 stop:5809 length:714 start_codon:yes stop_codon:yes gene_type:complete
MSAFNVDFMSEKLSAVLFDLDGTLVDSARDLTLSLNHVLRQTGRPEVSLDEVRHMVGHGARALIMKGMEKTGDVPPEEEIDQLQDMFLAYYQAHMSEETVVFPGVHDALSRLKKNGIDLAICTNKSELLTHKLLEELELAPYFTAVTGGDSYPFRKPDPRTLLATLEKMGQSAEKALMVGDSANDIEAARAAGLPVIGVSFGYTPVPVQDLKPDIVIDHYNEFFPALCTIHSNVPVP